MSATSPHAPHKHDAATAHDAVYDHTPASATQTLPHIENLSLAANPPGQTHIPTDEHAPITATNTALDVGSPADQPVGLFKLPRRLRDKVYKLLYQEREQVKVIPDVGYAGKPTLDWKIRFTTFAFMPELCRVNKQIKKEYDELSFPAGRCVEVDMDNHFFMPNGDGWENLSCPPLARHSVEMELSINTFDNTMCNWCNMQDFHTAQLGKFVDGLPKLERIHVKLYQDFYSGEWNDSQCDDEETCRGLRYYRETMAREITESGWTNPNRLPGPLSIKVSFIPCCAYCLHEKDPLATWTTEDGLNIHAFPACKNCPETGVPVGQRGMGDWDNDDGTLDLHKSDSEEADSDGAE